MAKQELTLFVRFSTNPEMATKLADECGYFHQNEMREQRIPDLNYSRYKEIYLPATADFRQAPKLLKDSTPCRHRDNSLYLRGDCQSKKKTEYVQWKMYEPTAEHLMEQAMERVGIKRLPCFAFSRRSFVGNVGGVRVTLKIDSVTDCPKGMQGGYLHLSPYGWFNEPTLDDLRQAASSAMGFIEYKATFWEPGCDYFDLLKQQYPKFPLDLAEGLTDSVVIYFINPVLAHRAPGPGW